MVSLTERADVYRSVAQPTRGAIARGEARIYQGIPCQIVPVSSFDRMQAYSFESTHVIWMPRWLDLLKEDEVRSGRRTDPFGDQLTYVYVVDGRRRFNIGLQHKAFYATERE